MQAVRDHYSQAQAQAQAAGGGAGWVEQRHEVITHDEGGSSTRHETVRRVFDPDAFTRWYIAQPGLENQVFGQLYGTSHTTWASDESGHTYAASVQFDNPDWQQFGPGGPLAHNERVRIDPNAPPRLHDSANVGFDLELGWATHHSNIRQKRDWFGTVVQIGIVAVVSWATAGAASGLVSGAFANAVVVGAAAGAAASVASGVMNDSLSFKNVLRGALTGAITGGVTQGLGLDTMGLGPSGNVTSYAQRALALTGRATLQGALQDLAGGSFREGFTAGLASGLGGELSRAINGHIASLSGLSAAERSSLQMLSRVVGGAVTALGNPDDPHQAFAQNRSAPW
jgi:hypothetical protein